MNERIKELADEAWKYANNKSVRVSGYWQSRLALLFILLAKLVFDKYKYLCYNNSKLRLT